MVYESDFYTTRRPYSSRPVVSSYSVTTPSRSYYSVTDSPSGRSRRADEQYSYSYTSTTEKNNNSSSNPYSRPERSSYSTTTERKSETGPGGYSYNTSRTSTSGAGPGGYSYSSTASGRLPHGTSYRHYSYHV
ncbi:protein anoxia up-regulated-like isoform X10 [Bradysia coprophila]|uniref:protein anoxia up-regulated-like isoform X10 n=1 Tax=Bradysia coprophila TaxID=38358 RepID=UPI00187DA68C|nr:protein anoxia up-regulated-like isoform X10 [Bradysia coprophila]